LTNSSKKADLLFLRLFQHPLLVYEDVGFLPGTDQEWHGIIVHGAKLPYASRSYRSSIDRSRDHAYGGAYDVMNSKHIGAAELCMANCRNYGELKSLGDYL
jgi:propionyl-CoA carboxylase beta chain